MEEPIVTMNDTDDDVTNTPPKVRCTVDTFDIQEMASRIMCDLGAGYSETIYQRALFNKISKIDTTAAMEKTVQVVYDDEVIGTCRADIVTAHHIIEVKAVRSLSSNVGNQIRKYMKNLHRHDGVAREGLVVNFNQEIKRVDFLTYASHVDRPGPVEYRRRRVTPCE